MRSDEIAFQNAPVGPVLTEDRVVRRCNLRFREIFDARNIAELVVKFSGVPL
ncbi:hypothetical protein [Oricola indica]|uniref:hypothetical protein n=1 Tax=Oricola indica TaxID=2872591 RepID=UPI003CCBEFB4